MNKNYSLSIYLDTRRKIKGNIKKYPVKLRLFTNNPRKQKLYSTKFKMTTDEYKAIWLTKNPRKEEYKLTRRELVALEAHAIEVAGKLSRFSIEAFERKMLNRPAGEQDVAYYYKQVIDKLKRNNQISTADSYDLSLKTLLEFHDKKQLMFYDITPQWLRDYEEHMLTNKDKPRSKTTVGIYLRYQGSV